MKIDWSKQRCSVCGGEFKESSIQVTDEQTGKSSSRKVISCICCGDMAFSPEQYIAQKMRGVVHGMCPLPSCGSSGCPGCVNCGRGTSNR